MRQAIDVYVSNLTWVNFLMGCVLFRTKSFRPQYLCVLPLETISILACENSVPDFWGAGLSFFNMAWHHHQRGNFWPPSKSTPFYLQLLYQDEILILKIYYY